MVKYGFVHTDPTGAGALVVVLDVVDEVGVVVELVDVLLVVVLLVVVLLVLVCVAVGDVVGDVVVVEVVDGCGVVVNARSAPKAVPAEVFATRR